MEVIKLTNLTKEYAKNVGCFDVNLTVNKGEVYGFIGPNGAGKSTVIRQMVGFIKSTKGHGTILGHDIWSKADVIMEDTGYLAGEVTLPNYMTGGQYLKTIANIRKNVDWSYVEKLINYFELNPKAKISKMSKGMKQKVAIIACFMHKPKVLILDEPTSGLDPLMQEKFNQLVSRSKNSGTTVFISSHIFGEMESNCDRVGFIKKGHMIEEISLEKLRMNAHKVYEIKFKNLDDYQRFIEKSNLEILKKDSGLRTLEVKVPPKEAKEFLMKIVDFGLDGYREVPFSLEQHFLKYYGDEVKFDD
ncbi:ABC-2 type transport system ATP-binding protein [Entomoplasma freundtii]|uniref:ABC transporter ATP-binding protein n=1 Tax=Entomoplasma freundtii TaxID=74700 RepID=A0A2K8NQT3_9MOLU|nr:ABC transporter ATP-binding protein [Entomoplasma freundtii]ATZ16144.1 ABC transporter ATP-binding protein [Entomoplasma freundtii]TDY56955.1 ABC-2 type transport system ATP-binding protein [Entomoplasma freundtii]